MTITGKRKEKGIWVKEYTLWTRVQIAILAYFNKHKNKPATYREIARAYGRANYPDYKKACDKLARRGYLEKLKDGSFNVSKSDWEMVKIGTETTTRSLPYFNSYLKKVR